MGIRYIKHRQSTPFEVFITDHQRGMVLPCFGGHWLDVLRYWIRIKSLVMLLAFSASFWKWFACPFCWPRLEKGLLGLESPPWYWDQKKGFLEMILSINWNHGCMMSWWSSLLRMGTKCDRKHIFLESLLCFTISMEGGMNTFTFMN